MHVHDAHNMAVMAVQLSVYYKRLKRIGYISRLLWAYANALHRYRL